MEILTQTGNHSKIYEPIASYPNIKKFKYELNQVERTTFLDWFY